MPTGTGDLNNSFSFFHEKHYNKTMFYLLKNFFANEILKEWQQFSLLGIIHIHLIQIIHLVSLIHFIQLIHRRIDIHILRNLAHSSSGNSCSLTIIIIIIITHRKAARRMQISYRQACTSQIIRIHEAVLDESLYSDTVYVADTPTSEGIHNDNFSDSESPELQAKFV